MSDRTESEDPVRDLARREAAALLEQVVESSRLQAAEIVRSRLTGFMVEELQVLLGSDRSARPPAGKAVAPALRPVGNEGAAAPAGACRAAGADPVSGWYVYGLTWPSAARPPADLEGVDGAPVEVVTVGPVAAVVSPISGALPWAADTGAEVDLETLAPRARRHEGVLEQMLDWGAVLPLRFGVLYPDLGHLKDMLRVKGAALARILTRVEGHCEWGLTVTAGPAGPTGDPSGSPDGRDYLVRRRAQREVAGRRAEEAAGAVAALHRVLSAMSTDSVVDGGRGGSAGRQNVVLRASYLIPYGSNEAFYCATEAELSACSPVLGLAGELTGPWPPYHFCDGSLEEVPA